MQTLIYGCWECKLPVTMGISAEISQKDEIRSTKMLLSYSLNTLNDVIINTKISSHACPCTVFNWVICF